jgi:hypothetical protein
MLLEELENEIDRWQKNLTSTSAASIHLDGVRDSESKSVKVKTNVEDLKL